MIRPLMWGLAANSVPVANQLLQNTVRGVRHSFAEVLQEAAAAVATDTPVAGAIPPNDDQLTVLARSVAQRIDHLLTQAGIQPPSPLSVTFDPVTREIRVSDDQIDRVQIEAVLRQDDGLSDALARLARLLNRDDCEQARKIDVAQNNGSPIGEASGKRFRSVLLSNRRQEVALTLA